ncbi:hypothetical protein EDD21DRAFT_382903 [Dissophora ornata]|nr:hypothetical protein EDD21DRAFT_382903 [Dissophora ornata]
MTASNSKNSSATDSSNNKSTKPRHHPSEAGLSDKAEVPSGTDFQATEEAVEAVEKEIMVLRSKEIVIPQSNIIEAALPLTSSSDSVAVVSSNSSPTQFYDSLQTRHALRTFLTNTERQFDEMVEYGFPCKQAAKNYRYLTLRITLTPWHARADEAKLYGASASMPGKQTQFKAMVNKFFSRSGGAYVAPATTSSLPPSQRARPSGAPRAYSDQSLRSPRRTDSLSSDKTNPRGAASPVPTGSERSRRHGRDYSYAKQLQAEEMNGSSPIPSQPQPQTQKQERRSSRYPHQLHALHQEQVRREQQLQLQAPMPQTLLRTSSRSDASLVSPPYPAPPSRSSSVSAIDETVEHVYECYQIVGAENIYKVGSQQQQERARSVTPMRQGSDSPPTYSRWMADRPLSMGPPPPLMPPPPPPRVNSKNRRRRALTIATGAAHPAGSVADAVAATASLAAIAKAAQFRTSQYCPPPQLLSTPYEDQEDSNQYDQEAEAYFETSMDFHNQEHKEVGEVDGEDYHYNRQESVEAVQAGGCWRPIQNRQTAAMKTYAFP